MNRTLRDYFFVGLFCWNFNIVSDHIAGQTGQTVLKHISLVFFSPTNGGENFLFNRRAITVAVCQWMTVEGFYSVASGRHSALLVM